jgi:DNA-binding IclR family transcriptional regulator
LGSKVLELANIFLSGIEWRTHATPYLKELRNKTDETVMVFVMDGDHRVCLEKFEGSHELRPMLNIGGRYPLHAGSAGKLLLAFLPEDERKKILSRTGLPRFTSSTITGAKTLEKELLLIRKRGYAISHQERMNFLSSVSVPIRDHSGKVIAAICIDGPTVRFNAEKVKEFKNMAIAAAHQISSVIGFKTPNSP